MTGWAHARRGLLLLLAVAWTLTLHMLLLATSRPVIRTTHLALAAWPAGTPPLRIALLSDVHTSAPSDTPARLAGVVTQVNAARPDLVLLAGDFMGTAEVATGHFSPEASVAPLAALRAPLGVLAVPGNHDRFNHMSARVQAALERENIPFLVNRVVRRGPLAILGLDDYGTGRKDIPGVLAQWRRQGGVAIAVTHNPAMLLRLPAGDVGIRLAGHTHCGQIALPFHGPLDAGSEAGLRYVCGVVRDAGRVTIVTGGIGTSILPFRLGVPPDLWMITLGPA